MAFIQLIEYTTTRLAEVTDVLEEWRNSTAEGHTARRVLMTRHRGDPDRYCQIVFFDSYESAMENSQLPDTQRFAARMGELVDGEPTFHDLDVMDDIDLRD